MEGTAIACQDPSRVGLQVCEGGSGSGGGGGEGEGGGVIGVGVDGGGKGHGYEILCFIL